MVETNTGGARRERLAASLRDRFTTEARTAGERLHLRGAVEITERSPEAVWALIEDPGPSEDRALVEAGVVLDEDRWSLACECESARAGQACGHQWAILLECESQDLEIAERAEEARQAPVDFETGRGAVDRLHRKSDAPAPGRRSRRWRARLEAVRQEARPDGPADAAPHPLRWLLDPAESEATGGVWLEIEGAERGPRTRSDEEILGALPPPPTGETVPRSAHLGDALTRLLLPPLARSGQLHLLARGRPGRHPLRWDGGEPWKVRLHLRSQGPEGACLDAALEKDGVRLSLAEVVWVSPAGYFFTESWVGTIESGSGVAWLRQVHRHGSLQVDPDEEAALLEAVLEMPECPRLEAPDHDLRGDVAPTPCLQLPAPRSRNTTARLAFDYDGLVIPAGHPEPWLPVPGTRTRIRRDPAAELRWREQLLERGVRAGRGEDAISVPAEDRAELVRTLLRDGWTVEHAGQSVRRSDEVRLQVRTGIDWFDLDGKVRFGAQWASLGECTRTRGLVPLGDGSLGLLDQTAVDWQVLETVCEKRPDGSLRMARHHGPHLEALLEELPTEQVEADEAWTDYSGRLQRFQGVQPRLEPAGFEGCLRPYQRLALGWFAFLRDLGLGGCLADDMGLGKTVQVLALLQERRGRGPSLVVAPSSLAFQWQREAERFAPELEICAWSGPRRESRAALLPTADLTITTYGTLRQDIDRLSEIEYDYVVLDEAHAIKNARSQTARTIRTLRARHRLGVTGTPVENRVAELGSLFEFLNPGLLRRFGGGSAPASPEEGDDRRRRLGRALRPCVLRRTKAEVLSDLPEKSEQVLWCSLDGRQGADYEVRREHYRQTLLGRSEDRASAAPVLEGLLRLRQLACHPGLLDPAREDESCAKFDVLIPMLHELTRGGHKALVFSQFRRFLDLLQRRLDREGLGTLRLDGTTTDRQTPVQRFQEDPEAKLFLISLGAGGTGLHLTAADYVFLLDPWWNPSAERQAVDRCHRYGQTRKVMAYRLICRDTVEEKVRSLQQRKQELVDSLLSSDLSDPAQLRRADLEDLLA